MHSKKVLTLMFVGLFSLLAIPVEIDAQEPVATGAPRDEKLWNVSIAVP